jgi:segregation and condensation protein A
MTVQAEYTIKIPAFEGPFDLLFHLVKKAEVDIWQISLADITDQYLSYLQSMKELNLDIASEFLVMAATLLRLKSKLLLPRAPRSSEQEDEEDLYEINSAEELFLRLEEYRIFKGLSHYLREREEEQQKIFLRSTGGQKVMVLTRQESVYTIWEGANHLSEIMLRFAEATKTDAYNPTFSAVEDFIIVEKSAYIETVLRQRNRPVPMGDFITADGLWEVIITFISLLELTKQRKVTLLQEGLFQPIMVILREVEEQEEVPGD